MPVTDDDEFATVSQSTSSKAEQRKSNKPIMEKRRRARINHCLNELKTLILNAMKKDPARHSKLEKADILEMTVKHLQTVQRQQLAAAVASDPTVITKFRSGFDECATEVSRYISRLDGVDHGVKQRLSAHLHRCVSSLQQMTPSNQAGHHDDNNNSSQRTLLIPSRLPTGELALVLPNSYSASNYLSSAANSAFTAIKNSDHHSPHFQPFKVEIPNSQLTAHISIPEAYEKRTAGHLSPKKEIVSPANRELERTRITSSQIMESRSDRLQLPTLSDDDRLGFESERRMQINSSMLQKLNIKPEESNTRLHAALVSQKPNPNYHLNPKTQSALKFIRHGEHKMQDRNTDSMGPPPAKISKYQCVSPSVNFMPEARSSVIVSDSGKDVLLASTSKSNQQDIQVANSDMWRPW